MQFCGSGGDAKEFLRRQQSCELKQQLTDRLYQSKK